jgi:hypothetical protein
MQGLAEHYRDRHWLLVRAARRDDGNRHSHDAERDAARPSTPPASSATSAAALANPDYADERRIADLGHTDPLVRAGLLIANKNTVVGGVVCYEACSRCGCHGVSAAFP